MSGEGRGNAVRQLGQITCSSEAIILWRFVFITAQVGMDYSYMLADISETLHCN